METSELGMIAHLATPSKISKEALSVHSINVSAALGAVPEAKQVRKSSVSISRQDHEQWDTTRL